MRISELLQKVHTQGNFADAEITDVTDKSNAVTNGCVFVCIRGARFDGHTVACDAEKNGAALIVAEHDTGAKNQVLVENTRSAYALLCAAFYGNPAEKLTLIGVTGTNGKTTTTMLFLRSTSSPSLMLRVWTSSVAMRPARFGRSMVMRRSKRPGRSSA